MKKKIIQIPYNKEYEDMVKLSNQIRESDWFTASTILVNCMPDYTSRLTHHLNHSLSPSNRNELLEVIDLHMPYPCFKQVWNPLSKSYEGFDSYIKNWMNDNVYPCNFLLICSKIHDGKMLSKVRLSLRSKLENENFRFASLYFDEDSIIQPDFYIDKQKGYAQYDWENPLNKNFYE